MATIGLESENSQFAKNRGRMDIVAAVVQCCERTSAKSHIMLVANINSVVATRILSKLTEAGLIDSVHEDGNVHYMATPRGIEFVRKYLDLTSMLSPGLVPSKAGNCNRLEEVPF